MESKTEQQLKLSKLEEGEYKFKVTVTGSDPASLDSKGEAVGIVTVFPGKTSFYAETRTNLYINTWDTFEFELKILLQL